MHIILIDLSSHSQCIKPLDVTAACKHIYPKICTIRFSNDFALFSWMIAKYWSLAIKEWTSLWYNYVSSNLAGSNLPVFMIVYIHFNVPPTRITDLVRNVLDKKINLIWNRHLCLCYCYYQLLPYDKRLFHLFLRVIIVQDFETVTFYALFVYKLTFCYFLLNETAARFKSVQ